MADAEGDSTKAQEIASSPDSFCGKPLHSRLATVLAGPLMNLIFCILLMPVVFMVGRMVPAILEKTPVIIGIKEDSPASRAGFQKDDLILQINGRSMEKWRDVLTWVMLHPSDEGIVAIQRGSRQLELKVQTIPSPFVKQEMGYVGFEPHFFWGDDPIVGSVSPNSPAEKAGLTEKDHIVTVENQPVKSWTEMSHLIRGSEGKEIKLTLTRDGQTKTVALVPIYNEEARAWIIGITKFVDPNSMILKRYSFFGAVKAGFQETWKLFRLTGDVLGRLFTFRLSYKTLGGPIQIAQVTGAAARTGIGEFFYFLAFLSMQLGILNLLPIPVLDGGHVLFMCIEGIRRKPLSLKIRNSLTQLGLVFLLGLMVLITFNDVDRIWGLSKIWEKITGIF